MKTEKMYFNRRQLIAPCGLDCRLCQRYNRGKNPCPGCRGDDSLKLESCLNCQIKNCDLIKHGKVIFCFECSNFPCDIVKNLDRRYRKSYGISVIENLINIKEQGLDVFVKNQEKAWVCDSCGETLSMHKPVCIHCGKVWNKQKNNFEEL